MPRFHQRMLGVTLLIGFGFVVVSCTKDEIPATPSAPFLFTSLKIAKTVTPVPGTAMTANQSYVVRFVVDYTLAPQDEGQKASRGIFADVYSEDGAGAVTLLATKPSIVPGLTAASGAVADSFNFTVPAGARFVTLEAYIDTIPAASFVLTLDDKSWPVQ